MSSGFDSLHRILQDETRRQIVRLLHEKGSLSYTDLLNELEIESTGKLNYHLKILDELLLKGEDRHYALSEKGTLASRLLVEFPDSPVNGSQGKPKWWRTFWIGTVFVVALSLTISFTVYFLGYIDLTALKLSLISLAGAVGLSYMIAHVTRDVLSKKTQLLLGKIAYTLLGVWLGLVASWLGGVLIFIYIGGISGDWVAWLWALVMAVLSVVGGFAGYRFGKKRGFKRPEPRFLGFPF
jgi:hypothetical protein